MIGDVHGMLGETKELLTKVKYDSSSDRLVFCGDLVDRGPDPAGVIRFIRGLGAESVMGNHDEKVPRYFDHEVRTATTGAQNPMRGVRPERLAEWRQMSPEDVEWIRNLPRYLLVENDRWLVVHAGFEAHRPYWEQRMSEVVRVRYLDDKSGKYVSSGFEQPPNTVEWMAAWKGPESVVYGHAVHGLKEPRIDEPVPGVFCYGIDTGGCFGGRLTALTLVDGRVDDIVQVEAYEQYAILH